MDIIETVVRESRHAARTLRRSPSFSLIAILTLGIGLGAATTIFTLLDRVVLRPLPYPNADRLIHIGTLWPKVKAGEEYGISRGQYFYFKRHSRALSDILFYDADVTVVPGEDGHLVGGGHPDRHRHVVSVAPHADPTRGQPPGCRPVRLCPVDLERRRRTASSSGRPVRRRCSSSKASLSAASAS